MRVHTSKGEPIDVELPAMVSEQHVVEFKLWTYSAVQGAGSDFYERHVVAELTLPMHLRYPEPGCEQRVEECERYAWVEVGAAFTPTGTKSMQPHEWRTLTFPQLLQAHSHVCSCMDAQYKLGKYATNKF